LNRAIGDGRMSLKHSILAGPEKPKGAVRLVIISDTHNYNLTSLPAGDILVHCGDFTLKGSSKETQAFCDWLEAQPFQHKVVIAGNHDMGLEFRNTDEINAAYERLKGICVILENSGTELCGLRFWGSPQTPYISKKRRMGFQDSSENLKPFWDQIPEGIDVLVTHGPPKGYGDRILLGLNVGCPLLMDRVKNVKPRYHLFGHIHEAYGTYEGEDGRIYVNASICNVLYNPIHPPVVVDVPITGK
jgi:Icc-related predicted phosphoesterase